MKKNILHLTKLIEKSFLPFSNSLLIDNEELSALAIFPFLKEKKKSLLIAVPSAHDLDEFHDDLRFYQKLLNDDRPLRVFPEFWSGKAQFDLDNAGERHAVLDQIYRCDTPQIILLTAAALFAEVPAKSSLAQSSFTLKKGDDGLEIEEICQRLAELNYDNEVEVTIPGEFARRGGILDIFSPSNDLAYRLDFFDDEIDSIRLFNPETQRSVEEVEEAKILPPGGTSFEEGFFLDYCEGFEKVIVSLQDFENQTRLYLPEIFMERWLEWKDEEKFHYIDLAQGEGRHLEASALAPFYQSCLGEIDEGLSLLQSQFVEQQIKRWLEDDYTVYAFCGNEGHQKRFHELFEKYVNNPKLETSPENLNFGFTLPKQKVVFLSENEVFGRKPKSIKQAKHSQSLQAMLEKEPVFAAGDYVVHAAYGVCLFHGIKEQLDGGVLREVAELEFAADRRIYLPIDHMNVLSRYVGGRKGTPKLSRIGTQSWKNACQKAQDSVNELAVEMLRVQAVRQHAPGHAVAKDNEWQESFEEAFPYEETEDQLRAIRQVKQDMESERPMDRLLCGDVGFGKTEVAIRAAFKAVMDGRQAAIIVPTTVLAQQHFNTFVSRMADYPVSIELLSRFVSKAEQKKTLKRLAEGEVDIVIGTHRLLQKDIFFAKLGLVVIDEEQRFGVKAKERLKQMRSMVDILTMTATPIPRTMHLSLAGLRDLSTIMTPPMERKPVKTIVSQEEDEVIRQSILRELERGGQVYYLHNRVQTIEKRFVQLQRLVPEAKFVYGHGRMHEDDLEIVMDDFVKQKADVLVSTTIIESGVDIQNANTMIIERADRFGLAELYQLRGRVGRYHHQAFCYLLLPKDGALIDTARERLAAIRRYTQLGAGFKLALRDLEIRGAGNLLGSEQSGHIAAVGFELYCQLLKDTVNRMENRPSERSCQVQIRLDFLSFGLGAKTELVAAFSPEFIEEEEQRIEFYKRLAQCVTLKKAEDLAEELRDRYGILPEEAENLLTVQRIKARAQRKKIHSVATNDERLMLEGENGFVKLNGKVPLLKKKKGVDKLKEIEALLKKVR